MAGTLPDSDQDSLIDKNEADALFQRVYGDDVARGQRKIEEAAANGGTDQNKSVKDLEDGGGVPANWKNKTSPSKNYAGNKSSYGRGMTPQNIRAVFKKKGSLGLLITLILGGGIGVGGFLGSQALLPIHIVENFVDKYNSQNTSMTIRTNKLIASKITNSATSGSCNFVKIACRFSSPSNKLLKNLAKNNIRALDKNGNVIETKLLFPNTRPASYEFTDKVGKIHSISAAEFSSTLTNNSEFRSSFHGAYNTKFIGYADSIFKSVRTRIGFTIKDSLANAKDQDDANSKINKNSKGVNTATAKGADTVEEIDTLLKEKTTKSGLSVAKSGRGNAAGLLAGVVCSAGDIPGLVTQTVRAYQLAQLIKYAAPILTAIGALKAGDATPQEINAIGNLFTNQVNGKSAMDSFGMRNTLYGDTKSSSNSYKKFSPGVSAITTLSGISSITSSAAKKDVCAVATSPVTGLAIDAATSETIVGPLINAALGVALSATITATLPSIVDAIFSLIPPAAFQQLLGLFLGDLTQNLVATDVGDAFTSGSSNLMGQTANAGANMPLTVQQKLAYDGVTQQVNLAYANEERATLSPFNAANQNTMLGSFVDKLLPYYSNNSPAGIFSSIGNIVTGSFGTVLKLSNSSAMASNEAQYSLCDDPSIKGKVAAGPFCNIEYGIPPEWLNMDPQTVLSDLVASGDINENTGEPIEKDNSLVPFNETATGNLRGWLDLCTDGTTDHASECVINDKLTAEYAIYSIDHRIQKTMDGMDNINGTADATVSVETGNNESLVVTSGSTSAATINSTPITHAVALNRMFVGFLPVKKYEGMIL